MERKHKLGSQITNFSMHRQANPMHAETFSKHQALPTRQMMFKATTEDDAYIYANKKKHHDMQI